MSRPIFSTYSSRAFDPARFYEAISNIYRSQASESEGSVIQTHARLAKTLWRTFPEPVFQRDFRPDASGVGSLFGANLDIFWDTEMSSNDATFTFRTLQSDNYSDIASQNHAESNALEEYVSKTCLGIQIDPLSVENEDCKIENTQLEKLHRFSCLWDH